MKQLSAADSFFVYSEAERTPMHIGGLSIYDPSTAPDGKAGPRAVRAFVRSRLRSVRAFRQRLVRVPLDLDYPYWIEDGKLDLDHHFRRVTLPRPGGWPELCAEVARLHARPLEMSRPLWEFVMIEGLGGIDGLPPHCFAILWKVHHALMDGAGGTAMSMLFHDPDPTMTRVLAAEEARAEPQPWSGDLLIRSYLHWLAEPVRDVAALARVAPRLARVAADRIGRKRPPTTRPPHTRFNNPVAGQRVWGGVSFELEDLRMIKRTVGGATINDVILTIVGGALRTYLRGKCELPDHTLKAMVPISTRRPGERTDDAGNQVSAMVVDLGTHLANGRERLGCVHAATTAGKNASAAAGASILASLFDLVPPILTAIVEKHHGELGLGNEHRTMMNCVVTNVPGSRPPLYFAGARLLATYGVGPLFDGLGLMNIASSYGPALTLSFTSDPVMMPEPEAYADALRASFRDLMALAEADRSKPVPKPVRASAGLLENPGRLASRVARRRRSPEDEASGQGHGKRGGARRKSGHRRGP